MKTLYLSLVLFGCSFSYCNAQIFNETSTETSYAILYGEYVSDSIKIYYEGGVVESLMKIKNKNVEDRFRIFLICVRYLESKGYEFVTVLNPNDFIYGVGATAHQIYLFRKKKVETK
jgi:hypothetical protein